MVRKIRKLEFWKPSDNLKSWLDPQFCPYKSSVDIRCSHAVSMITSDWLATKHSQQGLDRPTHDFVYPADCLFNNTWFCLSSRLSFQQHMILFIQQTVFSTTHAELAKTFLVDIVHKTFTCHVFANIAVFTDRCWSLTLKVLCRMCSWLKVDSHAVWKISKVWVIWL